MPNINLNVGQPAMPGNPLSSPVPQGIPLTNPVLQGTPLPPQSAPGIPLPNTVPQGVPLPPQAPPQGGSASVAPQPPPAAAASSQNTSSSPLSDNQRQQLDGIVQKMVSNGEPNSNIQAVVNDFKQKYGNSSDTQQPDKSVGGYLGNTINATGSLLKNVATGLVDILNPNPQQNTVVNLAKIVGGLIETPFALATGKTIKNQPYENFINNLVNRYGSWDKFKNTLYTDTPGALLDLVSVLDPAAKAVGAVGEAADVAKATELAKASDFVSTAKGLVPGASQEAIGALKTPGTLTKIAQGATKVADTINPLNTLAKPLDWIKTNLGTLAPKIEEANLRLTPTQQVNFASKLDNVTNYIAKELPVGSPETRYEAITTKATNMENQVQTFLKDNAKGITVDRNQLVSQAEALKTEFAGQRDALEIDKQIDGFKSLLEVKYKDQVPVTDLNTLKRSTFESAFNATGTKVSDAVEFRIGDMLYNKLKQATSNVGGTSLEQLNSEYSTIITAKKLLKISLGRPQVGFIDKIITGVAGGIIGNAVGGPIGSAAGAFLGKAASDFIPATGIKSAFGKVATKAAKLVPPLSPGVSAKIGAVGRLKALTKPPAQSTKP